MRSRILARTFVSAVTVVGIAAGSLAAAGSSFAASEQVTKQAAGSGEINTLATNNFGLTAAQAKNVQRWLARHWNYNGLIDGELGTNSWKAFQRALKAHWGYPGAIDGDPGENTVKALQRLLKVGYGYGGAIDGDPGAGTQTAFKKFSIAAPTAGPRGLP
ncbi:peptidoglycan-binding domain-containing protein [Streptomyces violarus]|uniref:peptidoglycan-binding domain-containing protein n=1 Tax=Streptomyces violarus TaxID=67380 RepID=UPI0021C047B1|nr:peptidoglycan-binding protein [Streptomyces violarus]MCT9144672.1 peptidoglycan-binding protein [Streptomyces violarus]